MTKIKKIFTSKTRRNSILNVLNGLEERSADRTLVRLTAERPSIGHIR